MRETDAPGLARGLCFACNYSLRGIESLCCPECGHEFDPNDPSTMNLGRPMGRLPKFILRPLGSWIRVPAWMGTNLALWASSLPWDWDYKALFYLAAFLWLMSVFILMSRKLLRWSIVRFYRQPAERLNADLPNARKLQRLFLSMTPLVVFRIPLYIAFLISWIPLNRLAVQRLEEIPAISPSPARWAGLYGITDVRWANGSVVVNVFGGGAFVYLENPPPGDSNDEWNQETRVHLFGHWYAYEPKRRIFGPYAWNLLPELNR